MESASSQCPMGLRKWLSGFWTLAVWVNSTLSSRHSAGIHRSCWDARIIWPLCIRSLREEYEQLISTWLSSRIFHIYIYIYTPPLLVYLEFESQFIVQCYANYPVHSVFPILCLTSSLPFLSSDWTPFAWDCGVCIGLTPDGWICVRLVGGQINGMLCLSFSRAWLHTHRARWVCTTSSKKVTWNMKVYPAQPWN